MKRYCLDQLKGGSPAGAALPPTRAMIDTLDEIARIDGLICGKNFLIGAYSDDTYTIGKVDVAIRAGVIFKQKLEQSANVVANVTTEKLWVRDRSTDSDIVEMFAQLHVQ